MSLAPNIPVPEKGVSLTQYGSLLILSGRLSEWEKWVESNPLMRALGRPCTSEAEWFAGGDTI